MASRKRRSIADESTLFGPDISELPPAEGEAVETAGGPDTPLRQFVNRWVFLKHQRPAALNELRELVTDAVAAAREKA